MIRAHRAPSFVDATWRLLAPVLVVALLLSAAAVAPAPVEAGGSSSAASIRARQLQAETAMRRADQQIRKLQWQRQNHKQLVKSARKQFKKATGQRDKARKRAQSARTRLDVLELRLKRKTQVRPDPKGRQAAQAPKLRKQVRKQKQQVRQVEAKLHKAQQKVARKRDLVRSRKHKPTKERMGKRVAERERAEGKLGTAIGAMVSLSKSRAGRIGAASTRDFRKPVNGTLSQRYGCTGYYANPRRGSCRRFHDGVDLAARMGRAVRASADGYVAYVGYSPWDTGRRAFIVVIGHSRGYETVYAHLKPSRVIRAGARVNRGQLIGRVGMTGTTSGPHVHWEVKRNGLTVNPLKAG